MSSSWPNSSAVLAIWLADSVDMAAVASKPKNAGFVAGLDYAVGEQGELLAGH